jgi:hypothetical protein
MSCHIKRTDVAYVLEPDTLTSTLTSTVTSTVAFEDSGRQHLLDSLNTGAHSWHRRREEIFIDHWVDLGTRARELATSPPALDQGAAPIDGVSTSPRT